MRGGDSDGDDYGAQDFAGAAGPMEDAREQQGEMPEPPTWLQGTRMSPACVNNAINQCSYKWIYILKAHLPLKLMAGHA